MRIEGPRGSTEIATARRRRAEESERIGRLPGSKYLQDVAGYEGMDRGSQTRASRTTETQNDLRQELVAEAIRVKFSLLNLLDPREQDGAERKEEIVEQWATVKRAIENPEEEPSAAIEIVRTTLEDVQRRGRVVKDRRAKEHAGPLEKMLELLEQQRAA